MEQSVATRWPSSHHFEDGVLFAVGHDGELTEVARVDVSTIDTLLLSVAKIRSLLVAAGATTTVAVALLFGLHAAHPAPAARPHPAPAARHHMLQRTASPVTSDRFNPDD